MPRFFVSWRRVAEFLFSTALVLGLIALILPRTFLSVREGTAGREIATIALDQESLVAVGYTHSMYGVRQNEVFSIGPGTVFRLERVEFGSLAAAIYYDSDPPSGIVFENGAWVINGNGKSYPVLTYRVSGESAHTLTVRGMTVDLSGRSVGSEGLIQLTLKRKSRWSSIFTP